MLYVVTCFDRPGAIETRMAHREDHLAYVEETGVVTMGGPFIDDAGDMIGSLIVLDVADMAAAEAWADGDPYAKAGLFDRVEINAWKKVIG